MTTTEPKFPEALPSEVTSDDPTCVGVSKTGAACRYAGIYHERQQWWCAKHRPSALAMKADDLAQGWRTHRTASQAREQFADALCEAVEALIGMWPDPEHYAGAGYTGRIVIDAEMLGALFDLSDTPRPQPDSTPPETVPTLLP